MPSDFEDDDVAVAVTFAVAVAVAVAVASTTSNIDDSWALTDRCPSVDDMLTEVKLMPTIQKIFNNSCHFFKKSDLRIYFSMSMIYGEQYQRS